MKQLIFVFFIMLSPFLQAQGVPDTCNRHTYHSLNYVVLTSHSHQNIARIRGLTENFIPSKEIEILKMDNNLSLIDTALSYYLSSHSVEKLQGYDIQVTRFLSNANLYGLIVFRMPVDTQPLCNTNLVLTQNGGGNSYFFLLYDLNSLSLIAEKENGW